MSLSISVVGYQSLISEGEIGAGQTRLSWFQRMRMRAALRLGGRVGASEPTRFHFRETPFVSVILSA